MHGGDARNVARYVQTAKLLVRHIAVDERTERRPAGYESHGARGVEALDGDGGGARLHRLQARDVRLDDLAAGQLTGADAGGELERGGGEDLRRGDRLNGHGRWMMPRRKLSRAPSSQRS